MDASSSNKEILISEIRKRPILWSREFERDRDRKEVAKSWNEISEVLGVSVFLLKREWLNLRTCYGREHKKVFGDTLCQEPTEQSNYQYFDSLSFLKDHIRHYGRKRNNHRHTQRKHVQVKRPGRHSKVGMTARHQTLNPMMMKRRNVLNRAKHVVSVLQRKRGRPRKNVDYQASSIVPHSCTSTPSVPNSCTSTPPMPDLIPADVSAFNTPVKEPGRSSTNQDITVNVPGSFTNMKSYVQSILDPHEQTAPLLDTAEQGVGLQKSNESHKQKRKVWHLLDMRKDNRPKFMSLQNRLGLRQKHLRKKKRHISSTGNRFVTEIPNEDRANLHFFKSLVPQLKNFTSQETCLFRIEVLKLLSDVIGSRQASHCQT